MILRLTSSREIPALAGRPRDIHASGAWFTDDEGLLTHRLDLPLWMAMGEPSVLSIDLGDAEPGLASAQEAMAEADRVLSLEIVPPDDERAQRPSSIPQIPQVNVES